MAPFASAAIAVYLCYSHSTNDRTGKTRRGGGDAHCRVNRDLQGFQVIGILKQAAPDDVNVVFSHLSETCYIKIVVVLVLYCLQVEEAVVITRNRSRK